jgi:hypothetical protein
VDTLDLLPVLGEEGDEVVDSEDNVGLDLVDGHIDVGDGNTKAERLLGLHLELDGGLGLLDLLGNILGGVEDRRELTGLVKTRTEETGDLTNEGGRSKEGVVLVGKGLDLLLVLVQELKIILSHGLETGSASSLNVDLVTDDANRELVAGDGGEDDGTGETLLFVGVVVLEAELKLNGLGEVALLGLGGIKNGLDGILKVIARNLAV